MLESGVPPPATLAFLMGIFVALTLVGDWRRWRPVMWLAKPAASMLFVLLALGSGALDHPPGRLVLAALVFSFAGDVLLLARRRIFFVLGLTAFLFAHLTYAVAFAARGVSVAAIVSAIPPLGFVIWLVRAWLFPRLPHPLRLPVLIYLIGISAMIAFAFGTHMDKGAPLVIGAALAFAVSDLAVARNRFVAPGLVNRLWGLPLYYLAQAVLALTWR